MRIHRPRPRAPALAAAAPPYRPAAPYRPVRRGVPGVRACGAAVLAIDLLLYGHLASPSTST